MKTLLQKTMMMVLVALFSLQSYAYDVEIDGIYYNLVPKAKVAEVTGEDSKYTGDVVIPPSFEHDGVTYNVTSIGEKAFFGCSDLTSVTIPNSITSIGFGAFFNCSGLISVTIPNSVTSISNSAFMGCSGLTSVTIPNSVTSIDDLAFEGCSGLTSVHITDLAAWCNISFGYTGANPLSIAHHLYLNGEEVKDMVIPSSVTSIGALAFRYCQGLTSVTIPISVMSISSYAFSGCSGLASVTIPSSITEIGEKAFSGCSGLTSIKVEWNRPLAISEDKKVFEEVDKTNCILYVPKGTAKMFMAAPTWSEFVNIIEYADGEDAHYITIRMGDGGVLKQSVEVGETYTYAVSADEGWEVSTITFDGKDMTSLLMDGQFSTPVITGNAELNVVFKQKGSGVKEVPSESDVKVYANGQSITVKGTEGNVPVKVYGTNGVLVKASMGNVTVPLESGIYIVKVGKESFKVNL